MCQSKRALWDQEQARLKALAPPAVSAATTPGVKLGAPTTPVTQTVGKLGATATSQPVTTPSAATSHLAATPSTATSHIVRTVATVGTIGTTVATPTTTGTPSTSAALATTTTSSSTPASTPAKPGLTPDAAAKPAKASKPRFSRPKPSFKWSPELAKEVIFVCQVLPSASLRNHAEPCLIGLLLLVSTSVQLVSAGCAMAGRAEQA